MLLILQMSHFQPTRYFLIAFILRLHKSQLGLCAFFQLAELLWFHMVKQYARIVNTVPSVIDKFYSQ